MRYCIYIKGILWFVLDWPELHEVWKCSGGKLLQYLDDKVSPFTLVLKTESKAITLFEGKK